MGRYHFDLHDQVFGRLTVVSYAGEHNGDAKWNCMCECGEKCVVLAKSLKDKRRGTKSCGCLINATKKGPKCQRGHEFTEENTIVGAGGRRTCRTCKDLGDKKYYLENKRELRSYRREWHLSSMGWSQESFASTLESQSNKCAVCSKVIVVGIRGDDMAVADHVHVEPPKPRGILCSNCNAGLGLFQENPEIMRAAIAYIEKWSS